MSTELVMLSNPVILCHPLLLLPSVFPNIRVFFNESALLIRWPKYWSIRFSLSNEYSGLMTDYHYTNYNYHLLQATTSISLQESTLKENEI